MGPAKRNKGFNMRTLSPILLLTLSWLMTFGAGAESLPTQYKSDIEQLTKLINAAEYEQAYRYAEQQTQWLGEIQFDYLQGIAALKTSHYHEAVFAFERVINTNPKWQEARLQLATAYFLADNTPAAKQEVARLQDSPNLRSNVANSIEKLKTAIARKELMQSESFKQAVSLGIGFDSNVNAGSAEDDIFIPVLNANVPLTPESQETESSHWLASYKANYSKLLTQKQRIEIGGQFSTNRFNEAADFNRTILQIRGGTTFLFDQFTISANAQVKPLWLDGELYRTAFRISGGLGFLVNKRLMLKGSINTGIVENDVDERLDTDNFGLGLSAAYRQGLYQHFLSWSYLEDSAKDSGYSYQGKDTNSVTYQISFPFKEEFLFSGALAISTQLFHDEHPLFQTVRDETLFQISNSISYEIMSNVRLSANLSFQNKDSNVELYEYNRTDFSIIINASF